MPVSSAAMADGNAALHDVASSQRHCSSRGYKLVMLRRRCCSAAMAGRADELLWRVGSTATLLCSDDVDGYAALQRWCAPGQQLQSRNFCVFFFFFTRQLQQPLFCAREREGQTPLRASPRKRKRKKESQKEKERESFETCLV